MKKRIVLILLALLIPGLVLAATLLTSITAYWKLDASSGNASDSVGTNTMVNTNSMSYTAGIVGNAINCDGTHNLLGSLVSSAITNFSMNQWVKLTSTSQTGEFFHNGSPGSASNNGVALCVGNGTGCANAGNKLTAQFYGLAFVDTGTNIGAAGWHMVTLTRDTTTTRFYVDGVATANTSALTPVTSTSQATICGDDTPFTGAIDEVGFWNRQLTQAEITSLYNSGAALQYPFGISSNTFKFWQFFDF